jgi:prolyl oligopeptidase PreP (S9A serine peptidase family)
MDDFALFLPVVGIPDPEVQLFQERGWVYMDDSGFSRDDDGDIVDSQAVRQFIAGYSAMNAVPSLTTGKPLMAFAGQYDTRVGPDHIALFVQALRAQLGPDAPVYEIEHEKIGHNGRAEYADEAVFVAKQFGLTLKPIAP